MKRALHASAFLTVVLATMAVVPGASAEILELSPSRAAILADDGTDTVKVALVFDLSTFPEGQGRLDIVSATLEWQVAGMLTDRVTEYTLHSITATWEPSRSVAFSDEPVEQWDVTPRDHAGPTGGKVRFRVTGLVEAWLAGRVGNHGLVVATGGVDPEVLADQLSKVRLRVLYGFLR